MKSPENVWQFEEVLEKDKYLDTGGNPKENNNHDAEELREVGNDYYCTGDWNNAIDKYNRSISLVDNDSKLFSL